MTQLAAVVAERVVAVGLAVEIDRPFVHTPVNFRHTSASVLNRRRWFIIEGIWVHAAVEAVHLARAWCCRVASQRQLACLNAHVTRKRRVGCEVVGQGLRGGVRKCHVHAGWAGAFIIIRRRQVRVIASH